jgi:hypothetical protein
VNYAVNLGVLGKHLVEAVLVGHVNLVEMRTATGEEFDAVDGGLEGVVQAVDDDDIVVVLEESERGE